MRKLVSPVVALLLVTGMLAAPPASAAFGAIVEVPAGTLYSPFGGPVMVTFTFDPGDPATIFTVRLREPGEPAIRERDYLVDPATDTSPHEVPFSWKARSVTVPTDYVIDVRRQSGGPALTSDTFTLLPPLVSAVSATPSPFYPLLQDGYKDTTRIGFSLAADANDVVVHIYADDEFGRCCGAEVRTEDLGPLAAGDRLWTWDGARDDASAAPKGTYYARVEATDTDDVTELSRARQVEIAKGWIRMTATRQKDGSAYSKVADKVQTAIGGDCGVTRDTAAHVASILCANAEISVYWKWSLDDGERIEKVSWDVDGGYYGCHFRKEHTATESYMRVVPTSTCTVFTAKIVYSYPVRV